MELSDFDFVPNRQSGKNRQSKKNRTFLFFSIGGIVIFVIIILIVAPILLFVGRQNNPDVSQNFGFSKDETFAVILRENETDPGPSLETIVEHAQVNNWKIATNSQIHDFTQNHSADFNGFVLAQNGSFRNNAIPTGVGVYRSLGAGDQNSAQSSFSNFEPNLSAKSSLPGVDGYIAWGAKPRLGHLGQFQQHSILPLNSSKWSVRN